MRGQSVFSNTQYEQRHHKWDSMRPVGLLNLPGNESNCEWGTWQMHSVGPRYPLGDRFHDKDHRSRRRSNLEYELLWVSAVTDFIKDNLRAYHSRPRTHFGSWHHWFRILESSDIPPCSVPDSLTLILTSIDDRSKERIDYLYCRHLFLEPDNSMLYLLKTIRFYYNSKLQESMRIKNTYCIGIVGMVYA